MQYTLRVDVCFDIVRMGISPRLEGWQTLRGSFRIPYHGLLVRDLPEPTDWEVRRTMRFLSARCKAELPSRDPRSFSGGRWSR